MDPEKQCAGVHVHTIVEKLFTLVGLHKWSYAQRVRRRLVG